MKRLFTILTSLLLLSGFPCAGSSNEMHRKAKRIEVYAISQSFWDVQRGETLSVIAQQLLPDNPQKRKQLIQEILSLNPQAFYQNSPNTLKANVRLWLPNHHIVIRHKINREKYDIKPFSWGQVYKLKH